MCDSYVVFPQMCFVRISYILCIIMSYFEQPSLFLAYIQAFHNLMILCMYMRSSKGNNDPVRWYWVWITIATWIVFIYLSCNIYRLPVSDIQTQYISLDFWDFSVPEVSPRQRLPILEVGQLIEHRTPATPTSAVHNNFRTDCRLVNSFIHIEIYREAHLLCRYSTCGKLDRANGSCTLDADYLSRQLGPLSIAKTFPSLMRGKTD